MDELSSEMERVGFRGRARLFQGWSGVQGADYRGVASCFHRKGKLVSEVEREVRRVGFRGRARSSHF